MSRVSACSFFSFFLSISLVRAFGVGRGGGVGGCGRKGGGRNGSDSWKWKWIGEQKLGRRREWIKAGRHGYQD